MNAFQIGDRVQILLGDERVIGTITSITPNPFYDSRAGSRYPSLYNVTWDSDKLEDGTRLETRGYLPFLLDKCFS